MFDKIRAIDPKIRFAAISDMKGQVLFGDHCDGVENLLSSEGML